jgi:K+-transporting ATPase ATPase C chain
MLSQLRPALLVLLCLTILTGGVYPLLITGIAKLIFPAQASGSLLVQDGKTVGSRLIGQNFSDPKYFWSRPSSTAPYANNALASGGSNLGPLNPALIDAVKGRVDALKAADPANNKKIPVDLVTASASGLDPDISVAAALYQLDRVERVRGVSADTVRALIDAHTQSRLLGFLGEPRVNVLELNLALDREQVDKK